MPPMTTKPGMPRVIAFGLAAVSFNLGISVIGLGVVIFGALAIDSCSSSCANVSFNGLSVACWLESKKDSVMGISLQVCPKPALLAANGEPKLMQFVLSILKVLVCGITWAICDFTESICA